MDQLDLKNAVLVGHSTSGAEVTRYIGRARRLSLSQFVKSLVRSGSRMEGRLAITEE